MASEIAQKIEAFFNRYPKKSFGKREILVFAKEDPACIFQLIKGEVREYDISHHGNEVILNVFKPPAFFPMSWAINKTPNQYFFETIGAVQIRMVPPEDAVNFIENNSDVMFDLLSRLYRGTDGLLGRMAHLMGGSARSRLIYELLIENARFGEARTNGSYFIPINESQLAAYTGLSRETVNREIHKLMESRLVTANRHGVIIKDLAKFEDELSTSL